MRLSGRKPGRYAAVAGQKVSSAAACTDVQTTPSRGLVMSHHNHPRRCALTGSRFIYGTSILSSVA